MCSIFYLGEFMIIINAKIYTVEEDVIQNGFIKFEDGKISKIGDMSDFNGDFDLDIQGKSIIPGFIDAHTHLGLVEDGISFEGDDVNEDTDPCTPQLRSIDGVNPRDKAFYEAYKSGVTTALITQGSANPIAGQMSIIKTYGICIDEMVINDFCSIKFALGENPKSVYNSKNQAPATRMATASLIRENLFKSKEYLENKIKAVEDEEDLPEFDFKYESLIPLIKKEVKAHFHCHRTDDIFTAIRIAKEFDLDLVLVHATESYMIPGYVKDYPVIIGPLMTDRSKPELANLDLSCTKILSDNDVLISLSTDHPETPLKYLSMQPILAIKEGVSEQKALEMITINPAKTLGISDRVGSLKEGKDADFIITDGNIFDYKTSILNVFINGEEVYHAWN